MILTGSMIGHLTVLCFEYSRVLLDCCQSKNDRRSRETEELQSSQESVNGDER